jgi:hypothetical protein
MCEEVIVLAGYFLKVLKHLKTDLIFSFLREFVLYVTKTHSLLITKINC